MTDSIESNAKLSDFTGLFVALGFMISFVLGCVLIAKGYLLLGCFVGGFSGPTAIYMLRGNTEMPEADYFKRLRKKKTKDPS